MRPFRPLFILRRDSSVDCACNCICFYCILHTLYNSILQLSSTPEQASKEDYTAPRIAAFVEEEHTQYYVIVEGNVLCEVPSLQLALFVMFSAYYIFHLEYPKVIKNVLYFLQDYVLAFPDSSSRPSVYLATASDIKKLSK